MCEPTTLLCDHCDHEIWAGWTGTEFGQTCAICRACEHSFYLHPAPGEQLYESNKPYWLMIWGKKWVEETSKKDRIKNRVLQEGHIDSGIRILMQEEALLIGENLHIRYQFILDEIHCPQCNTKGSLLEESQFFNSICSVCKVGHMR